MTKTKTKKKRTRRTRYYLVKISHEFETKAQAEKFLNDNVLEDKTELVKGQKQKLLPVESLRIS